MATYTFAILCRLIYTLIIGDSAAKRIEKKHTIRLIWAYAICARVTTLPRQYVRKCFESRITLDRRIMIILNLWDYIAKVTAIENKTWCGVCARVCVCEQACVLSNGDVIKRPFANQNPHTLIES